MKELLHIIIVLLTLINLVSCNKSEDFFKLEDDPASSATGDNEDHYTDTGILLKKVSQVFYQKDLNQNKADILWVIDNSGSMADEQVALDQNFKAFIKSFIDKKIDFKIGITTAESSSRQDGHKIGDFNELTLAAYNNDSVKFYDTLSKNINIANNGSSIERGIDASLRFLDRYSSEFLRDDANLIIIYLSDEEDQSSRSVKSYLEMIQDYKNNRGLVKAFSIVNTNSTGRLGRGESIGKRYIALSEASGGSYASIKKDFGFLLSGLGESISSLIESFSLSSIPHDDVIKVFVDGVKIDKGFIYDSASRSIKFVAGSIPSPGVKIEIRYFAIK